MPNFVRQQNSTAHPVEFYMVLSSDHVTPATGKTPVIKAAKDATGSGASVSGAVTELDSTNLPGWYSWAGNATDRNTLGDLVLVATATGCDNAPLSIEINAADPFAAKQPVTLLDSDFTIGGATLASGNGMMTMKLLTLSNSAAALVITNTGTGSAISITTHDTTTNPVIALNNPAAGTGDGVKVISGQATIESVNTVLLNVVGNVNGSVLGDVNGSVASVVGDVSGNVAGNVVGDLSGRVLGNSTSPFSGVGTWALDDAGASIHTPVAAIKTKTDQLTFTGSNVNANTQATAAALTFNLTGNITGNLSGSVGSVTGAVTVGTNNDKSGYSLAVTPPTAAAIATAVLTDTTASDFTVVNSPGYLLLTNLNTTVSSRLSGAFFSSQYTVPPTVAQIATGVWQDTTAGDFTVAGSVGKVVFAQLGGAFTTTSSSIFSVAALANAPAGGGGGGGTVTVNIQDAAT